MSSLGRYFDHTMQRIEIQIICDWNSDSFVAFYAGDSQVHATCAISSFVDLQYLLGTTLHVVLKVVFNLKTKQTPPSRFHSRQPKGQMRTTVWRWVFIVAGLAASRVQHCWLQHGWDVQRLRRGRAIKAWAEKERKKQPAMEAGLRLASRASSSFKIC